MKFTIRTFIELTAVVAACLAAYVGHGVLGDRNIASGVFLFSLLCGVRAIATALNFTRLKKVWFSIFSAAAIVFIHSGLTKNWHQFPYRDAPWGEGFRFEVFLGMVGFFLWYYLIAEFFRVLICGFFSSELDPKKPVSNQSR